MANILILGAGAMGTAFAFPCSDNKHNVKIVGTHLENDTINELNSKNFHPGLNLNVLKTLKFFKHESIKKAITEKPDLIVLGVSSKGIVWVANELKSISLNGKLPPILMLTKGLSLHEGKYELLVDKLTRLLLDHGIKNPDISAVGGPCLAKGLANKVHTSVVFANKDINVVKEISKLVSTKYYHVFTSTDVIGVETCAAIKNIFSMAIGASQGLCHLKAPNEIKEKNYLNTAAALIQESIYEMIIFVEKMNGKKETVMGLAGIGDLYVSAAGGRNSKMGEYLGKGMTYKEAKKIKMPNDTVEGADLALEIGSKVKKDFDEKTLPLMNSIIDTICNETPLKIEWKNFK